MTLIERITEALKEENCSLEHAKSLLENEDLVTKTCWDCRNIPVQIETQASLLSEAKAEIERLGKVAEEAISVLRSTAPELARSTAHQGRRLSLYFHLMEQEKAKEKTDAN